MLNEVLEYMPKNIKDEICKFLNVNKELENSLEEIRIRVNKRITLKTNENIITMEYITTKKDLETVFENICEKSVYSYISQIAEGFITIKGGNRVGIVGACVIKDGQVVNINYISSLNFRIARQIKEVSVSFLKYIIDIENNSIFNTIIVSPPGSGKTTLLRDLIRKISNGIPEIGFRPKICGIVDERNEISAMYKGIPQNDVGENTDILENVNKSTGIIMLIRSMSPQIIACDEIGSKEDIVAIKTAFLSGVKGIFTAHSSSIAEIEQNKNLKELIDEKIIKNIIVLDSKEKGKIKEVKVI